MKLKPFLDLEFSDAFLFAAVMEDEGLSRDILSRILEVPPELATFLHFVEDARAWRDAPEDGLLKKLHERISYLKHSRRLEERYMLFGEMLDDERREGRREGQAEGRKEGEESGQARMLSLIQAMCADGKSQDVEKLTLDQGFLEEMLERYHLDLT